MTLDLRRARGRGLGRQLMAVSEERGRREACTRIRVETFGGELGFYQTLGGEPIEMGAVIGYTEVG